jgi:hypothetical protein
MKLKWYYHDLFGEKVRIYYYPELSTPKAKAVILSRFALKRLKWSTSTGDHRRDKRRLKRYFENRGIDMNTLPRNCDIHHNALGTHLEWIPKDIHEKIPHIGAIGIIKRANS